MHTTRRSTWKTTRFIAVAACCCLLLALTSCGARRSEQSRADGDTYLNLGKTAEARAAYEAALEANPDNPMAHLGLARCAAREDDVDAAVAEYQRAVEKDPALEPAYLEAVQLLLDHDRVEDAQGMADAYAEVDAEGGGILGAHVARESGDLAGAVAILEEVKAAHPDSGAPRVTLAATYLLAGEPGKAEAELRPVLESISPDNLTARMTMVEAYRRQGKNEEMLTEFEQLVEQDPTNTSLRLALARALLYAQRLDEAEAIAREVQREQAAPGWAEFVLGACLAERGNIEEALPLLETAAEALPDEASVSQMLALAKSGGEAPAEPSKPSASVGEKAPAPAVADKDWQTLWREASLGELLSRRESFLETEEPDLRETLVLSAYFTLNSVLAAELAEGLPEDSPVRQFSEAIQNRDGEALRALETSWTETTPERQILRENAMAFAFGQAGARTGAVQRLATVAQEHPDNAVALLNTAQIFRRVGAPRFASRVFQRLIAQSPDNINAHALLYTTLREGDMQEEALLAAETTYAIFNDQPVAYLNLAQAYADTGDFDMANSVLGLGAESFENKTPFLFLKAGVLLRAGDAAGALETLTQVPREEESEGRRMLIEALAEALAGNWPRVLEIVGGDASGQVSEQAPFLAAAAYLHADRAGDARVVLETEAGGEPRGGTAGRLLHAALGDDTGETPLPDEQAALAQALAGANALAADFAFAMACQDSGLADSEYEILGSLVEAIPDNDVLLYLRATTLGKTRRLEDKPAAARALAEANPGSAIAWIVLASICRDAGDAECEDTATAKAVEVDPASVDAQFSRGRYLEESGDLAGSAQVYRDVLAQYPDNPAASNNLAYLLLMIDGDMAEALKYAEAALEDLPNDASVRHTLGVCQLRTGDYENSRRNLGMALEMRPGDPTLMLDYGLLLDAQGNKAAAAQHLALALTYADQFKLDFPRRAEAEAYLAAFQPPAAQN